MNRVCHEFYVEYSVLCFGVSFVPWFIKWKLFNRWFLPIEYDRFDFSPLLTSLIFHHSTITLTWTPIFLFFLLQCHPSNAMWHVSQSIHWFNNCHYDNFKVMTFWRSTTTFFELKFFAPKVKKQKQTNSSHSNFYHSSNNCVYTNNWCIVNNGMCVGPFNVDHDIFLFHHTTRNCIGLFWASIFFVSSVASTANNQIDRNSSYSSGLVIYLEKIAGNKKKDRETAKKANEREKCNWWIDCSSCDFCTYIANQENGMCMHKCDEEIYCNVKICWIFSCLWLVCVVTIRPK